MYMQIQIDRYIHAYIHTYIHTCINTYIYIYIYIYRRRTRLRQLRCVPAVERRHRAHSSKKRKINYHVGTYTRSVYVNIDVDLDIHIDIEIVSVRDIYI